MDMSNQPSITHRSAAAEQTQIDERHSAIIDAERAEFAPSDGWECVGRSGSERN